MKKALVLSGGGSKGAYQAGCVKALTELGHKFDIVTGTSIGALNGLLIVQQEYDKLYNLWETITVNKVMKKPINFNYSIESMLSQVNLIIPFFKAYINEKGADIDPLKEMINGLYDNEKFFANQIDYGIVTIKYPNLQPVEISKDKMLPGDPVNYALASAACFPAFPIYYFNQQGYVDGSYYDRLPISLAIQLGATQIIAIELNLEPTHQYFLNRPHITIIRPYHDLGGFLDFTREVLDERIQLGYFDTLKAFKELKGYQYTFEHDEIPLPKQQYLYNAILKYENKINRSAFNKALTNNTPITTLLLRMTFKSILSLEDYSILSLETALSLYKYQYTKLYDYQDVSNKLYTKFMKSYKNDKTIIKDPKKILSKKRSKHEIINHLYYSLEHNKKIDISFITTLFTKEFICALYFYTIKNT